MKITKKIMKELTLAFDDLEKVSGGNFVDELTEEDVERLEWDWNQEELHKRV